MCNYTNIMLSMDFVKPCKCRNHFEDNHAMLRCEKITGNDVIIDVLNKTSDYSLDYLTIDLASLTYIPAKAFEIKKLKLLVIVDTTMISLFNEPPKADYLEGLTCYGLKLSRAIQWDLFTGIPKLRNLTIENSPLKSLDAKFVEYAPKTLEKITISNCSISKVHEEAFKDMKKLKEVVMDKGKIKVLKRSMFPTPAYIKKISFKNQKIETLPDDLFSDFPYLMDIWLTGNLISTVSEATFKPPFMELRSLLLDDNPIKCNCAVRWIAVAKDDEPDNKIWRNFLGKCEEPKDMHGKNLYDLRKNHFQHCEGNIDESPNTIYHF